MRHPLLSGHYAHFLHRRHPLSSGLRSEPTTSSRHPRLRSLPPATTLLLATLLVAALSGCEARPSASPSHTTSVQPGDAKAQRLLRRAAAGLEARESVTARIRQTVHINGHSLVGSGSYQQMHNPREEPAKVLSRIELRLQVRERTATWEQVCDGETLWTLRKVPELDTDAQGHFAKGYSKSVEWVDLDEAVGAVDDAPPERLGIPVWGLGGLSRVLTSLAGTFAFHRVRAAEISGVPMWVLEGTWNRRQLLALLPEQVHDINAGKADLSELPPRLPDSVAVYLGKDDLFPFRIVYRRHDAAAQEARDLVNVEFYQVSFDTRIDARKFQLARRKRTSDDDTPRFLRLYRETLSDAR